MASSQSQALRRNAAFWVLNLVLLAILLLTTTDWAEAGDAAAAGSNFRVWQQELVRVSVPEAVATRVARNVVVAEFYGRVALANVISLAGGESPEVGDSAANDTPVAKQEASEQQEAPKAAAAEENEEPAATSTASEEEDEDLLGIDGQTALVGTAALLGAVGILLTGYALGVSSERKRWKPAPAKK